jgi:hypothetical protein
MFGIFLFLTYYLQQTLGYSPLVTGFAFLPWSGCLIVLANLSTIVLMPRFGPKPLVACGMLAASAGTARQALTGLALAHGYETGFWWIAGIFASGAVVGGVLLRRGPLAQQRVPSSSPGGIATAQTEASQEGAR